VLLSPVAAPGGAERALAGLARRLPEHGFSPSAVLLEDGPAARFFEQVGCPVQVLFAGRTKLDKALRLGSVLGRLRRLLLAGGAAVVVGNQAKGHLYAGLAAAAAGVPAVFWQQGVPGRGRHDLLAARVPAAAVVCSSELAAEAQRALTPHRPVRKVHLGVDVAAVAARAGSGGELRRRAGLSDRPVVAMVGRLQPWKGQRTFLRAASLLAPRFPEAVFVVVGGAILGTEGSYPEELRRLSERLGIAERVWFAGHQDDVYPFYDAADVVVHASEEPEPFGLVLVEAMALGKPLVATAAGGPLEIVEAGSSGLLVPPGDPEALAFAVARLLEDPALRARLGEAAARRAACFDERRMAARFAEVLASVLGQDPAGGAG
jgi:glycosyltransferase involved in cell wall biosynthesis